MTGPRLIGEIVRHEGTLSIQTRANVWYPLGGNSWLAMKFEESFGEAGEYDLGKRLYWHGGVMQMESIEQRDRRVLNERHL